MASVNLKGLSKYFGESRIIESLDLDVLDGEFLVIVGPSGCGKSTLLRILAGLDVPTAGDIDIGGRRVNDLDPRRRDIAMVFQSYALYPHMSVYKNMAYGLKLRGLSRPAIAQRVDWVAKLLGLEALLSRKPRELSGGQRQRVAMGRAIVREPEVFLFDEPLSNLDAQLRAQVRLDIKRLHQQIGTTTLYVTHDQIEAMTLAHRIVVMNQGRVEQIGTPVEIYERPASTFVAGFLGSPPMNLLRASLDGEGRRIRLKGGAELGLTQPISVSGAEVWLGVRPEDMEPIEANQAGLTFALELYEPLGGETLLHGTLDTQPVTVRMREFDAHTVSACMRFRAKRWHLFAADGRRLEASPVPIP
ncbi:hypothetical protein Thpro_020394 [Acidihalobacter prosperus]|uniref:ABC transporter domain-containing protein n=2 Tax=Acidihalobacter prosperus TaxID=160660 RepID=A0A1A6C7Y3_9GAMM|nr:hypothetical protein Thpro_020394 [Acidihalobacter prosperus]